MTFRVTTSNHYYTQHHNTDEPDLHLVTIVRGSIKLFALRIQKTKDGISSSSAM